MSSQPNRVNTSSPFPTPSSSPGAVSLPPESEWSSTGSEWSLNASAQSSRAPTPLHPVSRCATPANPPTQEHLQMIGTLVWQLTGGRLPPLPPPPSNSPAEQTMSRPVTPAQQPKRKRVARPANAFMLYRSHLIKSGAIPKNIESRQQNISRIAGECWNLLSKEDKAYWHREAEKIQEIHKLKNPDYKFAPSRKTPKAKKALDGEDVPPQGHPDTIRYIREKYVGISGPAVPPPRPRKPKSRRNASAPPPTSDYHPNFSVPPGILPPSLCGSDMDMASAPPNGEAGAQGTQFMPGPIPMPDYALPMSMGLPSYDFVSYFNQFVQPPAHRSDDTTSKPSTFNDIAPPTEAKFNFPTGETAPETDLGLSSSYVHTPPPPQDNASRPQSPSGKWEDLEKFMNVPDLLAGGSGVSLNDTISHDPSATYHLPAPFDADVESGKWLSDL